MSALVVLAAACTGPTPVAERPARAEVAAGPSTSPGTDAPSAAATPPEAAPSSPHPAGAEEEVVVESVTDGDTLVVSGGVRVRLIGIDTPETRHPERGRECFGPEAAARTAELVPPGEAVRLVYDADRLDRYERTLAYVFRQRDGLFLNGALVEEGFARAGSYPPNVARDAELADLEQVARGGGRGLWGACPLEPGTGTGTGGGPDATPGTATPGVPCDPAYPQVCLPPPPPDLSCSDVADRSFRVRPPDPHGLDGNGDGVGCELPPDG